MKTLVSISELPQIAIKPLLKQKHSYAQLKYKNKIKG